jgi:DNA-binding SARP family transcriptional activator
VLDLPSGAVVGVTMAAGIAAALTLARCRRRARRHLGHPADLDPPQAGDTSHRLARFAHARTTTLPEPPDDGRDEPERPPVPPHPPFAPTDPRAPHPGRVVIAERDGEELAVDLAGFGAITLTGPHAADAARAAVVALLTAGSPYAAEVILASDTLLAGLGDFPGLRRIPDLAQAVDTVEQELLGRARLFEHYGAADFPAMRRERPDDQQPALLLVTDQPLGEHAGRLAAMSAQGPRLGVGALLVNATLEGAARIRLDEHGRVEAASPRALSDAQLVDARILRLTEPEAVELLGVLAASRTDPATDEPPQARIPADAPPSTTPLPEPARTVDPAAPAHQPPVRVRLLGTFVIETRAQGGIRTGLRRKARELLAFALLHPGGFTAGQAIEALWPDADPAKTPDWYWNALSNLRKVLAQRAGKDKLASLERDADRYRVEPATFEVDLWRVEQALAAARHAHDDQHAVAALGDLATAATGILLGDAGYGWAEIPREELRRRVVDALARLAELRAVAGDRDGALAALDQAIELDPLAEELYRRTMRLQADLGRPDAVRRTYHALERRLADLDLDVDDATEQLLTTLLHRPRQKA